MRKFALLFAFVLVMACAGGAFAGSPYTLNVDDLKLKNQAALDALKGVLDSDAVYIATGTAGLMDDKDYAWIYEKAGSEAAGFTRGTSTFTLRLDDAQTVIPDGAFKGSTDKVTLSTQNANTLIKIGESAFEGMTVEPTFTNILDSNKLEEIGAKAFKNSVLPTGKTVTIDSVTFEKIGESAFEGSDITTMVFTNTRGNKFDTIPKNAFKDSTLSTLTLTSNTAVTGLKEIGEGAFKGTALSSSVTFADAVALTTIGVSAFENCATMTGIVLPATVKTINDKAFKGCITLASFSPGAGALLETIGKEAFAECYALSSLIFTNATKLTKIDDNAFKSCAALTTITYLEKAALLDTIGAGAFAETKVTQLDFPTKLENIGAGAFSYKDTKSGELKVTFRKDSTAQQSQLNGAADVAAFLTGLDIAGAFSGWPEDKLSLDSFKIGYGAAGATDTLRAILDKSPATGGIKNDPDDATTKSIVEALSGAGFGDEQILKILSDGNGANPVLTLETITAITDGVTPPPPTDVKGDLQAAITTAQQELGEVKIGDSESGDYYYTTLDAWNDFNSAITDAQTAYSDLNGNDTTWGDAITALEAARNAFLNSREYHSDSGNPPPGQTKTADDLLERIGDAQKLYDDIVAAVANGQLSADKADGLLKALSDALRDARAGYDRVILLGDDPTGYWKDLDDVVIAVEKTLKPSTGYSSGGNPSKSSGGCAAGFAPIAALFVLGAALKFRKGR